MLISPGRGVVRPLTRCHRPWPGCCAPTNPPAGGHGQAGAAWRSSTVLPGGRACRARSGCRRRPRKRNGRRALMTSNGNQVGVLDPVQAAPAESGNADWRFPLVRADVGLGGLEPPASSDRVAHGHGRLPACRCGGPAANTGPTRGCRGAPPPRRTGVSTSPSQRLALVGLPERRLPPVRLCPDSGPPTTPGARRSGTPTCRPRGRRPCTRGARLPTPVMVSSRSRAWANRASTRSIWVSSSAIEASSCSRCPRARRTSRA
jgi:hypothetical protein